MIALVMIHGRFSQDWINPKTKNIAARVSASLTWPRKSRIFMLYVKDVPLKSRLKCKAWESRAGSDWPAPDDVTRIAKKYEIHRAKKLIRENTAWEKVSRSLIWFNLEDLKYGKMSLVSGCDRCPNSSFPSLNPAMVLKSHPLPLRQPP